MGDMYPVSVNDVLGTQVPLTTADPAGDVLFLSTVPRSFLLVHNSSASPVDVTLSVPGTTWNGHDMPDTQVTVPTSALVIIPMRSDLYADQDKHCTVTYSSATGVRVASVTA